MSSQLDTHITGEVKSFSYPAGIPKADLTLQTDDGREARVHVDHPAGFHFLALGRRVEVTMQEVAGELRGVAILDRGPTPRFKQSVLGHQFTD